MPDLAKEYGVPPELMAFINSGFLEVSAEHPGEKTVEFRIPSKRHTNTRGETIAYTLTWIHPAFNAQFCHYDHETPGDVANFSMEERSSNNGDNHVDLETVDDLVCLLEEFQTADVL